MQAIFLVSKYKKATLGKIYIKIVECQPILEFVCLVSFMRVLYPYCRSLSKIIHFALSRLWFLTLIRYSIAEEHVHCPKANFII